MIYRSYYISDIPTMSDIKEDIIRIASEKMKRVGIRSLSIDDICRMMSISKKTFYVHFATKEDLLEAVLQCHEEELKAKVFELIDHQSIEKTLQNCLMIVYETKRVMQPPAFIFDIEKYYPQLFEEYKKSILKNSTAFAESFLQKGVEAGVFRKDLDVAMTSRFLARLHQGLLDRLSKSTPEKEIEMADEARYGCGLILRSIVSREGAERVRAIFAEIERNNEPKL